MDYINITLIILSALTVLFTLFLCFIATIAFLGWRNLKDIEEKQKTFFIKKQKILEEASTSIEGSKKDAAEIIQTLKLESKKAKLPSELEEQNKRTEELIERLNNAIDGAEKRMGNLRMVNITSTPSVMSSDPFSGHISASLFSSDEEERCSNCGRVFYVSSGPTIVSHALSRRCPYCGHENF